MGQEKPSETATSWLEKKLAALEALYHRFGRKGLKDQPLADVRLLLSSKEMLLRDAAKGRDLAEDQKARNRRLELEVKDLTAHMKGQLSGLGLSDLRSMTHPKPDRLRQNEPQKTRDFELDR